MSDEEMEKLHKIIPNIRTRKLFNDDCWGIPENHLKKLNNFEPVKHVKKHMI